TSGNAGGYGNDVAFGGIEFVVAGTRPTTAQPTMYFTQNPIDWSSTTFTNGGAPYQGSPYTCSAICYDPADFVFVTAGGAQFAYDVWTSYDGHTWADSGFSDQQV